jgi:hypothetical protein
MRRLRHLPLGLGLIASLLAPPALASFANYAATTASLESGGRNNATNQYSSATGKYQFLQASFVQSGDFVRSSNGPPTPGSGEWGNGSWNPNGPLARQFGVTSREQFMNNPAAQDYMLRQYTASNWQAMQANGASQYIGRTVNGVKIDESALLSGAHFLGPAGMKQYLETGQIPGGALGNHPNAESILMARMAAAAGNDVSELTGQFTPGGGGTPTTGGGGTGGGDLYCDPEVARALVETAKQNIERQTVTAASPAGYTRLGGQSVIPASQFTGQAPSAGIGGSTPNWLGLSSGIAPSTGLTSPFSGSAFDGIPGFGNGTSYANLSCLERLMSVGWDGFFRLPTLDELMNQILSWVCSAAQGMFNTVTAPLNQSFYTATQGIGFGPGLSMGSMGVGFGGGITQGTGDVRVRGNTPQVPPYMRDAIGQSRSVEFSGRQGMAVNGRQVQPFAYNPYVAGSPSSGLFGR